MKYLFVDDEGNCSQSDAEPTKEDLEAACNDTLQIFQFEPKRGFCRAMVEFNEAEGEDEEDEYELTDWEMLARRDI